MRARGQGEGKGEGKGEDKGGRGDRAGRAGRYVRRFVPLTATETAAAGWTLGVDLMLIEARGAVVGCMNDAVLACATGSDAATLTAAAGAGAGAGSGAAAA